MDQFTKFKNIVEGWSNLAFKNPVVEEIANERATICSKCPFSIHSSWIEAVVSAVNKKQVTSKLIRKGMVCSKCNCPIAAKSRALLEECPEKKWETSKKK